MNDENNEDKQKANKDSEEQQMKGDNDMGAFITERNKKIELNHKDICIEDSSWTEAMEACSQFAKETNLTEDEVKEALKRVRNKNNSRY